MRKRWFWSGVPVSSTLCFTLQGNVEGRGFGLGASSQVGLKQYCCGSLLMAGKVVLRCGVPVSSTLCAADVSSVPSALR